jgi:cell division protein FtsA
LSGGHIEELAKPMYSTCIGLILKGYNDYENKNKTFENNFVKVNGASEVAQTQVTVEVAEEEIEEISALPKAKKKTIKGFMDNFKTNLIEMFREEEDAQL